MACGHPGAEKSQRELSLKWTAAAMRLTGREGGVASSGWLIVATLLGTFHGALQLSKAAPH
jgi:hypothetical protein